MLCLVQQADKTASHSQLLRALGHTVADTRAARSTLGVLVSRLRRKVDAQGASLPVQSLHNRGYMFTDDITMLKDARHDTCSVMAQHAQGCNLEARRLNTMLSR